MVWFNATSFVMDSGDAVRSVPFSFCISKIDFESESVASEKLCDKNE